MPFIQTLVEVVVSPEVPSFPAVELEVLFTQAVKVVVQPEVPQFQTVESEVAFFQTVKVVELPEVPHFPVERERCLFSRPWRSSGCRRGRTMLQT